MPTTKVIDLKLVEKLKYVHFRPYCTKPTKQGLLTKHYARNRSVEAPLTVCPKGGVSLGYIIKDDKTIWIAATRCGRRDLFNRKRAISIIQGRMGSGKYDIIKVDTKNKDKVFEAIRHFIES